MEKVEAVDGAKEALRFLSQPARIYIATGAADSSDFDIKRAFSRVGLDQFVSGYFCESNVGYPKGHSDFLPSILSHLSLSPSQVAMVGDSLVKDIEPARQLGIHPIWLTKELTTATFGTQVIRDLRELCI